MSSIVDSLSELLADMETGLKLTTVANRKSNKRSKHEDNLLVYGYMRNQTTDIPKEIVQIIYIHFSLLFVPAWSRIYRGNNTVVSNNNKKVKLIDGIGTVFQSCRGRDPIIKGMIVEWTLQCYATVDMCIGVVKSNKFNEKNNWNLGVRIRNANSFDFYGIATGRNRISFGKKCRWHLLDKTKRGENFEKYEIRKCDSSQIVTVVCDYRGHRATLTYYINGIVVKPHRKSYTFELPSIKDSESWYMMIDLGSVGSWCAIIDGYVVSAPNNIE